MNMPSPSINLSLIGAVFVAFLCAGNTKAEDRKKLDPAGWGANHVGQPIPDYITGGQCLFCHRQDVGPKWQQDPHRRTIDEADPNRPAMKALGDEHPSLLEQVTYLLGNSRRVRYLKPSERYGQVDILNTQYEPAKDADGEGRLIHGEDPKWKADLFANQCAGCHATAVDIEYKAFSGISHDCFVCHGVAPQEHSAKPELALFAEKREDPARIVASVCGSCHIRTGESKSTGMPYPNTYVPGDNLFIDFKVDFSDEHLESLNIGDRHVLHNIRDVVIYDKTETTCVTCHDVHDNSSRKHRLLKRYGMKESCAMCHTSEEDWPSVKTWENHSEVCQY